MEIKTLTRLALMLLLAVLLACACGRKDEPLPDGEADNGMVNLVLRLSVNAGGKCSFSDATRQSDMTTRTGEVSFDTPISSLESVNTLRIIIVRTESNNLVEYNKLIHYPENVWQSLQEEKFQVAGDEWKRVYLIANEASLADETEQQLKSIEKNKILTVPMEELTLSSASGKPYINNGREGKEYIPMSEFFDLKVKPGIPGETIDEQVETLFITRAVSKFSFSVTSEPESVFSKNGLRITELKISGMADMEWLFPHNTIYNPTKYEISTDPLNGRLITSFASPSGISTTDYKFTPTAFGIRGTAAATDLEIDYSPLEYFLESPADGFNLTVTAVSNGLERQFGPVKLPNLPRMPRNTHTVINLKFNGETMEAVATVYPYTAVNLNPNFGFGIPTTGLVLQEQELTLYISEVKDPVSQETSVDYDSVQLGVTIEPENSTDRFIEWASSNSDIATVDDRGMITAVSAGTADITIKCGGITGVCKVTVIDKRTN